MTPTPRLAALAAWLALAALALPARAGGLFDHPVDAATLGSIRGGFATPDGGLIVSFGVSRSISADGSPVASATDASTLLVLQRGAGNRFDVAPGATAAATVIQNSLDNQKLQTVTTLDVTTNSLQAFRGAAFAATLRSSLTDSLRR